ncbi:hypothetical protein GHT06_014543 [Daphnia sinensis]|uniref:Uncharacterized protein n=1 Tax=Daphnia sinensis TaxID=1820382 RepID=A0AAD5KQ31_9CRUS|nr:hypothetical protein GHT06_014543 [Daphnia sinensis]
MTDNPRGGDVIQDTELLFGIFCLEVCFDWLEPNVYPFLLVFFHSRLYFHRDIRLHAVFLFWLGLCISSTYSSGLQPPAETRHHLDIEQDTSVEDVQFSIVSINDELTALGEHPETLCPFRVENRTVEQDHPLGNLVVEISEIVCSGSCTAQRCGGAGSTCKQLTTDLRLAVNHPVTGLPETVIVTNMAIGCSCAPDDPGALGEQVLRR